MKKHVVRREAIKYIEKDNSYGETIEHIKERFDYSITRMTLYRWIKRLETNEWDFQDISQKPNKLVIKFSKEEKEAVRRIRKTLDMVQRKLEYKPKTKESICLYRPSKG